EWNIRACRDFGEIVFNMVESGMLAKTERDSIRDFEGGYDFDDAFRKPFLPPSKLASERFAPPAAIKSGGGA
ncbi:MAG TPA: Minf_1886 family protein, partial [Verrucomicrobiae bacterium]